jgi:hypothetical protein
MGLIMMFGFRDNFIVFFYLVLEFRWVYHLMLTTEYHLAVRFVW